MAESQTTSSQSNCPVVQPKTALTRRTNENIECCPEKVLTVTTINKSDLQTARTNMKGSDQSFIPVQTNLHRLIQNKLKRKKTLQRCNTTPSIDDSDNNSKRKKKTIIGNCSSEDCDNNVTSSSVMDETTGVNKGDERITSKPPLPPKPTEKITTLPALPGMVGLKQQPPTRIKRKLQDQNATLIQKLNSQAEQLRLEVGELKISLTNERNAVRALRAQNEAEARKSKAEIKKVQVALELSKKAAAAGAISLAQKKTSRDDGNLLRDGGATSPEVGRMSNEILALKEANRILEEKIQMYTEAERRKTSDIIELKDSYEIRLTQISKSAKNEINRLLEEIKSKERNIGQLKKEIQSLRNLTSNKRHSNNNLRNVQHPPEMKKLKDIERNSSTNSSNQKCINTTCGDNEFTTVPHEITERILESHNDLHIFGAKDSPSSDTDSALSSAPQSISPQPPANGLDPTDIWQSVNGYQKELENLQNINEEVQKENEKLKMELNSAKEQILDLEKTAFEVEEHNCNKIQQLVERIKYLEQREDNLVKESHELREQNELLEFRILELEECHDKWSLRSNCTPDTRDMWTDTEKESDDLLMYMDRSDSGITSPHSHHHIDDRNVVSPYDLSLLDQISNDEIKRRITSMIKKPNIDEEDKYCLLQVLTLMNNLETLSQDSLLVNDEMISLEMVKSKGSDYSGSSSSSPRSLLTDSSQSLSKGKRIVATVLPYTSSCVSTPSDSPRRIKSWNSISLQESGVFEGDSNDSFYSQGTQTETDDFPCVETSSSGDLCAEIQKLNKFREKIEEVVTKQATKVPVPTILSPNLSDQKRLQYYKDRLELLENKIIIYESSGDLQTKRLAERLQREIQLEALAKDLRQRVEQLEAENLKLEEERCEFEEAENDTRLRLQRLEIDLEILNQRNIELEMSREAVQNKFKDAKNQCTNLQLSIQKNQERLEEIESDRKTLQDTFGLLKTSMPALVLFGALMVHGTSCTEQHNSPHVISCSCHQSQFQEMSASQRPCMCHQNLIANNALVRTVGAANTQSTNLTMTRLSSGQEEYDCQPSTSTRGSLNCEELLAQRPSQQDDNRVLQSQLHQLMDREKELTQNISELNRAYQETMENADMLWAQIEKDYKDKLSRAEEVEQCLKMKISQLEGRLMNEDTSAQERIAQLEESENALKHKICCLNKQNKDLVAEHEAFMAEYACIKLELRKLKCYIEGPGQENLEREKKKVRELEEDLCLMNRMVTSMEEDHRKEMQQVRNQLCAASKELENIEVTNAELKEEVCTLEQQICELQKQHNCDEERIQCLMDEIKAKAKEVNQTRLCQCLNGGSTLAQEMSTGFQPVEQQGDGQTPGFVNFDDVDDLKSASKKLDEALDNLTKCSNCGPGTGDVQTIGQEMRDFIRNIFKAKGEEVSEENLTDKGDEKIDEGKDEEKGDNDKDDEDKGDENKGDDEDKGEKDKGDENEENEGQNKEEEVVNLQDMGNEGGNTDDNEPTNAGENEAPNAEGDAEEAANVTVETALISHQFPGFDYIPPNFKLNFIDPKLDNYKIPQNVENIGYPTKPLISKNVMTKFIPKREIGLQAEPLESPELSVPPLTRASKTESFTSLLRKLRATIVSPNVASESSKINTSQQTDFDQANVVSLPSEGVLIHSGNDNDVNTSINNENALESQSSKKKQQKVKKLKLKRKSRIENLIELLRPSVSDLSDLEKAESNLKDLYKTDKDFKKNLKLILRFKKDQKVLQCYDEIVRAMSCLKAIEALYRPISIPVLKSLEEDVSIKLLEYHQKSPEKKLYCAVYYPEEGLIFNN